MNLIYYPNPVLLEIAKPVQDFDIWKEISINMIQIMKENNGCGLAAPQVGISNRVFVYDLENKQEVVINPEIIYLYGKPHKSSEGCLSIPGKIYAVCRFPKIKVSYYNLDKTKVEKILNFRESIIFQHEFDHLNGLLINR